MYRTKLSSAVAVAVAVTVAIAIATVFELPLASGFSLPTFSSTLPAAPVTNDLNFVASLRSQFQRNDLKKQLVAAATAKDETLVLSLIDDLARFNPTECPTLGLAGYDGGSPDSAPLGGAWRLLFTNAKDAEEPARTESNPDGQFGKSAKTGVEVTTGQSIDAARGECVNFIALAGESRPFDRLEITIKMTPLSDRRVRLDFLRGLALNEKAPLPFLKEFRFSFPPAVVGDILARIRGKDPSVEPQAYFDVLYIDDTLRVHRTGEGKVFVQQRA
mmetsp:Transcript_833/g.2080  ORF Transcript_833/g.2080 Transcript_833/m.2080 type:complete len:274 (+) Transcript_833:78-899(+)